MSKIDIVYTWVDGSDPVWQHKKKLCEMSLSKFQSDNIEEYGNVNGRYRSSDELLYSIRSLEAMFPEHGTIYIVTDQQKHPLIDDNKVVYVNHSEIMSGQTFSSKKIESNLFKINGLSENFLYFNDDVFLSKEFVISDFLENEKFYIHYEKSGDIKKDGDVIATPELIDASYRELNSVYGEKVKIVCQKLFLHNPKIINKKLFKEFTEIFDDAYQLIQKEVFRDKNIPSLLSDTYFRWLEFKGYASQKEVNDLYVLSKNNKEDFNELLVKIDKLSYFCIGDISDNDFGLDEKLSAIQAVLNQIYPIKSKYELPTLKMSIK